MSDEKDPVVHSSLSKPLFISSLLLVLVTGWALWDEIYGIRPWKSYQARFVKTYSKFLKGAEGGETALEDQIKNSSEYKRLTTEMEAAPPTPIASRSDRTWTMRRSPLCMRARRCLPFFPSTKASG